MAKKTESVSLLSLMAKGTNPKMALNISDGAHVAKVTIPGIASALTRRAVADHCAGAAVRVSISAKQTGFVGASSTVDGAGIAPFIAPPSKRLAADDSLDAVPPPAPAPVA